MIGKSVAIIQSSYIPWKGYFDIIHDVDEFIFLDDAQFTRQDWRSRNKIKTSNGLLWLTVPTGDAINRRICEVGLLDSKWQSKHWKTITQSYARAPQFSKYRDFFEQVYLGSRWTSLSELNQFLIIEIAAKYLGIKTSFSDSRSYSPEGQRQNRLLDILKKAGATTYISGPAARAYIDESQFDTSGIELIFKDYNGYPEYPQLHPPFEHCVSILDVLFHVGNDAPEYIWGWR